MRRVVGTDSNGGVLYLVPGKRRRAVYVPAGTPDTSRSTARREARPAPAKAGKTGRAASDKPAGREGGGSTDPWDRPIPYVLPEHQYPGS